MGQSFVQWRSYYFVPTIILICCVAVFALIGCRSSDPPLSDEVQIALLDQLVSADNEAVSVALDQILVANDPDFIAPLIDLIWAYQIGVIEDGDLMAVQTALETLSDAQVAGDWVEWVDWYSRSDYQAPAGYIAWKGALYGRLDDDFGPFFSEQIEGNFRVGEIVWGGVRKDGIPSLDFVEQVPITEADGYTPKDAVFGISINGDHRAYPLRVMDWHEMANDVVGGVPIALTYCTLCGSAIVYETSRDADDPFVFGSSGLLYRSNKLMFDRQTNTVWNQLTGEPVMGPLVGQVESLERVPIVITTLEDWAAQHPDATIVPLETGFFRDYTAGAAYGDYFATDTLLFPIGEIDGRLPAKAQVFALEINGAAKAYPVEAFVREQVINDAVGGQNVVLIGARSNVNVYGYSYELEYVTYSAGGEIRAYDRGDHVFHLTAESVLMDEDGNKWQVMEEGLVKMGAPQDTLDRLSGHVSFWFGWQSFFPKTAVYEQQD